MHLAEYACQPFLPPSGGLGSGSPFGILGSGWLELTALALAVSLLMLVLAYMLATVLRNQNLLGWAKFELYQVLGTAVLVIFTIAAIVGGMCSFDMGSFSDRYKDPSDPTKGMNMYDIADRYFTYMESIGEMLFLYLMYVVKQITFLSKVMWTSNPLGVGSQDSPLESLGQLNNLLFLMVSGYLLSYLLLLMQTRMLEYISYAVLFFLYPFGVFFRAFEPTRGFGGTLMGLSIALFLFYPIIVVINDYVIWEPIHDSMSEVGAGMSRANDPNVQGAMTGDKTKNSGVQLSDKATRETFTSGIVGAFFFLVKPVMLYFMGAVVLPVLNFIILVEIARGITHMFGEEIDVTNLTRLI